MTTPLLNLDLARRMELAEAHAAVEARIWRDGIFECDGVAAE
jgi:hypothetical protein